MTSTSLLPPSAGFARPPAEGPGGGPAVLVTGAGGPAGVAVVRRLVALGHRVVAVDADPAAVADARHNLRGTPWARVHAADAAAALARGGWPPPALAVLDPPRAGAPRQVIDRLLASGAGLRAVAYVSCDPAILARDIAVFAGHGWRLAGLRAFDIFPMTHHVECVAALTPAAPGPRPAGRPSPGRRPAAGS